MSKPVIKNHSNQSISKVKFGPVTLDSISRPSAGVVAPSKDCPSTDRRTNRARMSHASIASTSSSSAQSPSTSSIDPAKCSTYRYFNAASLLDADQCAAKIDAAITNYEQFAQFIDVLTSHPSSEAEHLEALLLHYNPDLTKDEVSERYAELKKRMRSDLIDSLSGKEFKSPFCPGCATCDHFDALFAAETPRSTDFARSIGPQPPSTQPDTRHHVNVQVEVGIASAALKWSGPDGDRKGVVWTPGLSRVTEHMETILGTAVPLVKLSPRKNGATNILHPAKVSSTVKASSTAKVSAAVKVSSTVKASPTVKSSPLVKAAKLPTTSNAHAKTQQPVKESVNDKETLQADRKDTPTTSNNLQSEKKPRSSPKQIPRVETVTPAMYNEKNKRQDDPQSKKNPRLSSKRSPRVDTITLAMSYEKSKKQDEPKREAVVYPPYFQAGAEMLTIAWHLEDLKIKRSARKQKHEHQKCAKGKDA